MDRRRITIMATIIAVAACALSSGAKAVPFVYNYVGNDFTVFNGGTYMAGDKVTGTFTVDLTSNISQAFADHTADILSFSFSDGPQTIDDGNGSITSFSFGTDVSGDIDGYTIEVMGGGLGGRIVVQSSGFFSDLGEIDDETSAFATDAGTWTKEGDNIETPVPPALPLLLTGLAGFAFLRRRAG